jgi:hypothetical protein
VLSLCDTSHFRTDAYKLLLLGFGSRVSFQGCEKMSLRAPEARLPTKNRRKAMHGRVVPCRAEASARRRNTSVRSLTSKPCPGLFGLGSLRVHLCGLRGLCVENTKKARPVRRSLGEGGCSTVPLNFSKLLEPGTPEKTGWSPLSLGGLCVEKNTQKAPPFQHSDPGHPKNLRPFHTFQRRPSKPHAIPRFHRTNFTRSGTLSRLQAVREFRGHSAL